MAINEQLVLGGLNLNDYLTWYVMDDPTLTFEPARKKQNWSGSALADGEALVGNEDHYGNANLSLGVATYPQPDKDSGLAVLGDLVAHLQEARRTPGGLPLVWTPAGSAVGLTWYVLEAEVDTLNTDRHGGWFDNAPSCAVHLTLRPFGYAQEERLPLGYTDAFTKDSWTGGPWKYDEGSGVVWFGVLAAPPTALKRLYLPFTTVNSTTTMRFRTSTTLTGMEVGITARRLSGASNYLRATLTPTALKLAKLDGDLDATAFTPAAGTYYWMQFSVIDNDLSVSLFPDGDDPGESLNLTPLVTTSAVLDAGDAALGSGIRGNPGMYLKPGSVGNLLVGTFKMRDMIDLQSADPLVTFEVPNVPGHVPADSRLVVQEAAGVTRNHFEHGFECRDYDPAVTPPLLLDSSAPFVTSGYFGTQATVGGVSCVSANNLPSTMPVQSFSTGPLLHVGIFKVKARVSGDAGVRCRLAWRVGDGQFERTSYVALPDTAVAGTWYELEFPSPIDVPTAAIGAQSWEGRLETYNPNPDVASGSLHTDFLEFIPMEGWGGAAAPIQPVTPQVFSVLDEFKHTTGGPITGKTVAIPAGSLWAVMPAGTFTPADTDDFTLNNTLHRGERVAMGDTSLTTGRLESAGNSSFIPIQFQADVWASTGALPAGTADGLRTGVFIRGSNMGNWLALILKPDPTAPGEDQELSVYLAVYKRVGGGTPTLLGQKQLKSNGWDRKRTLQISADAAGQWAAYVWLAGTPQPVAPYLSGIDLDLATSGPLETGLVGLFDVCTLTTPVITRYYDNMYGFAGLQDAVLYANRSLEIRSDRAEREAAGGTRYGKEPRYNGPWFFVPAAGGVNHVTRMAVKARTANVAEGLPDDGGKLLTVAVYGKGRYLVPQGST